MKPDERKYIRDVDRVAEDGLWPAQSIFVDPQESRRHGAIAEVLCRMSDEGYDKLAQQAGTFAWFIPEAGMRAGVWHFTPPSIRNALEHADQDRSWGEVLDARILYLSPVLEKATWDHLVAIVAHELAHIALGHDSTHVCSDEYEAPEEEAFKAAVEWGFARETKKLRRVNKWRTWWQREGALNRLRRHRESHTEEQQILTP